MYNRRNCRGDLRLIKTTLSWRFLGMGNDFNLKCQVETRRVLWLIALVLASVLIIQYFELPYRDSMLSLLSSGKSFFNANSRADRDTMFKEKQSIPRSRDENVTNFVLENAAKMNPSAEMANDVPRPVVGVSPSLSYTVKDDGAASPASLPYPPAPDTGVKHRVWTRNVGGDISPAPSFAENRTVLVWGENARIAASPKILDALLGPVISPSSDAKYKFSAENVAADISPSAGFGDNDTVLVLNENAALVPVISPSQSVSTGNVDIGLGATVDMPGRPLASVVSISEMNDMLIHSRVSSFMKSPLWPSAADQELLEARFQIENAAVVMDHPRLYAPIYRNLSMFMRSYEIMEQKLKVYIYKDGKRPVFHQPRLKGIYASEGWFMKLLKTSSQFLTNNPGEAHLFYLPFSSQLLVDYAPFETKRLMANCIRTLCNADVKEGFQFGKDVSLPETYIQSPQNPMKQMGGNPPSGRKILAFFAGKMHGYVRPILLKHWENKDPDMKIFGRMQAGSYIWHMKKQVLHMR
ncbi:UNVERIFIED_CONTAM: putative glycosyltransferase [Sesamum calycinum]|uniref:Glycosyltransferase n=1 Tax=Sesamum calycinum TaxID=2727403 RepID=A0AAW2QWL1_9LAMI